MRLGNLQLALTLGAGTLFCFMACGGKDRQFSPGDEPSAGNDGTAGQTSSGGSGSGDDGTGGRADPGIGGSEDDGVGGLPMGGAPTLDGPPTVEAVAPADEEEGVTLNRVVRLDFSEGLEEATVTAANIQIKDGASALSGTLTYQAGTVLFTPDERHSLLTEYTVEVGTGVTDKGGSALAAPFSSSFSTRDGVWHDEASFASAYTKLSNTSANAAMDGTGNALVAWTEDDGNVYSRWYDAATDAWLAITPLETRAASCRAPHVAVSANGNAVVMFTVSSTPPELWARRYVNGAWETGEQLVLKTPANNTFDTGPRVLFQGDSILAAWSRHLGSGNSAVDYVDVASAGPSGAWKVNLELEYAAHASPESVSVPLNLAGDGAGNAMLAYGLATGNSTMFPTFVRYTASTGAWSAPAPVRANNPVSVFDNMDSYGPIVALNPDGDALMVWVTQGPTALNVVASHFTRAGGWEAPVTIKQGEDNGFITPGAVAAHGNDFTVVWKQIVGSTFNAYRDTYSTAAKAWGDPMLLSSGDTDVYFGDPNIFGDRHGNALAAWSEGQEDNPSVTFARFNALSGKWSAPAKLTTLTDEGYVEALLVGSQNGTAGALLTTYKDGSWTGQRFNTFH